MIFREPKINVELSEYEQNRALFTREQLDSYRGQWVAFSVDGKRVVASDPAILDLQRKIQALGETSETVALECFPTDDDYIRSGVELH